MTAAIPLDLTARTDGRFKLRKAHYDGLPLHRTNSRLSLGTSAMRCFKSPGKFSHRLRNRHERGRVGRAPHVEADRRLGLRIEEAFLEFFRATGRLIPSRMSSAVFAAHSDCSSAEAKGGE